MNEEVGVRKNTRTIIWFGREEDNVLINRKSDRQRITQNPNEQNLELYKELRATARKSTNEKMVEFACKMQEVHNRSHS